MKQPKLVTKSQFEKMTPAARRKLVAKDVLAALKTRRMVALKGIYMSISEAAEVKLAKQPAETDARVLFGKIPQCHVCAIGSVFVAAVERFDNVKLGNDAIRLDGSPHLQDYLSANSAVHAFVRARQMAWRASFMEDVFPARMLRAMEAAFENGWVGNVDLRTKSARKRLALIMEHIVKHGEYDASKFAAELARKS